MKLQLVSKDLFGEQAPQQHADFETFWSLYPRHVKKKYARECFNRIRWTPELWTEVITALEQHKRSNEWTKDNGEFVPHPSSWLNGERWTDELEVTVKAVACAWPKCRDRATGKWGSKDCCESHLTAYRRGETP